MSSFIRPKKSKLAVFSGQYFWSDGDRLSTDEAFVGFVTSFSRYFDKIIFCDAVKRERKIQPYILDPRFGEVCPLPDFNVYSFWRNLVVFPKIYRILKKNSKRWDLVWLPGPHPVSILFAYSCLRKKKPFFLVIRSNLFQIVKLNNKGVRRYAAMFVVAVLEYFSRSLAKKNLVFTVGKEMFDIYRKKGGPVFKVNISLVSEKDIVSYADVKEKDPVREDRPVRLLSVGRLDPEKGLPFLIDAIERLVKNEGINVVLWIVGKGYKTGEEEALRHYVKRRELDEYVRFWGYISHGPDLFKLYRESDIFVIPSLTEAVPQTLLEALALGIPVVATRVAGIPSIIHHKENGLLIEPGSPEEICRAVKQLINNKALREKVIKNGLEKAKLFTLEAERDRMMDHIKNRYGHLL